MTSSTTDRRLGLSGNAAIKTPCYAATTTAITLSGEQSIDGVTTSSSRVLVKNQASGADNGIYVSNTGAWTRDLDFDGAYDARSGTLIFVTNGSANGAGLFQLSTADPITIGTTSLTFTKIATLAGGAVTQTNVQNGQFIECTVAGTNTITATTVGTVISALGHGQYVFFTPANTNTAAATFARDGTAATSIFYNGAALIGGELQATIPALLFYDGTQYQLINSAIGSTNFPVRGTVTAAATLNLNTVAPYSQVTGTTGVTAVTLGNGRVRYLNFAGSVTFTAGASLILNNGGANVTTAAGDNATVFGESGGVVRMFFHRASGNTVSGSSLVPRSYIAGLTMSTAGSSATMTIAAGSASDSTNSTTMTLSSAISKTTSAWAVGTANGGLDTGAIATSTWYHFYQIMRTDTNVVDVVFSLSASAPTLPTNYSLYRRIGAGKTDGSSQWTAFTQTGDDFLWSTSVLDVNATNPGTSAVSRTLTVPTGVIVTAKVRAFVSDAGISSIHLLSPLTESDAAPSTSAIPLAQLIANDASGRSDFAEASVVTNTSAQIRSRASASGASTVIRITTVGWTDRRGRDS